MKVPLLDLKAQYETIKDDVQAVTKQIFEEQRFILGPEVEKLERKSPTIAIAHMRWAFPRERMRY